MTNLYLTDNDYTLAEGCGWFEVGPFAIRIAKIDEGLSIDVYRNGKEDENSIASLWCLDSEAISEECEG